jgi:CRP-like cAMP-binding protein
VATHRRLLLLLSGSAEDRYTEFVASYRDLARRLPQHQIAAYLGVTPESLSRVRARIARRAPGGSTNPGD